MIWKPRNSLLINNCWQKKKRPTCIPLNRCASFIVAENLNGYSFVYQCDEMCMSQRIIEDDKND